MKIKTVFIVVLNVILCAAVILAADYCYAEYNYNKIVKEHFTDRSAPDFDYNLNLIHFSSTYGSEKDFFNTIRRKVIPDNPSDKKSVLFLGCSFAYGEDAEDNETIEYYLAQKTGRIVYNRGLNGAGLSQMLYMLRQDNFYSSIDKEPEYAVYIFITDHIRRIFIHKYAELLSCINYEKKNGVLIEKKLPFYYLRRLSLFRAFMKKYIEKNILGNTKRENEIFDLVKLYFEEAGKELQARYPDIKFVIMKYPAAKNDTPIEKFVYNTDRWKELEDEGFIIYDLEKKFDADLESSEYVVPGRHPKPSAWKMISSKFASDLKL